MEKLSMTYLVDFANKAGTPKVTVVRTFKARGEYDPRADFYRPLRAGIVEMHEEGRRSMEVLDALLRGLRDPKKKGPYAENVEGYKRFLGSRSVTWFKPPVATWTRGKLEVSVNPELGLVLDGKPHLVKLYCKGETLTRNREEMLAHLMHEALRQRAPEGTIFGILDVRAGKLITPKVRVEGLDALLLAEADCFVTIYDSLPPVPRARKAA
jgi:hypothetical protein